MSRVLTVSGPVTSARACMRDRATVGPNRHVGFGAESARAS
ncbi:hypothetical protein SAZ_41700 [Streptomyces noursei ZPM]|nr:hypothetical protein SAZ_41700 [Streptomyces noursei ZPM]EPY93001.1 hypothetical protein K530_50370 [Streptomyces noursei CCRC 11814]